MSNREIACQFNLNFMASKLIDTQYRMDWRKDYP